MVRNILKYILHAIAIIVLFGIHACTDEIRIPNECPDGKPATITVALDLGEITNITRGDMQAGVDSRISCLWIAVYNVASGQRTGVYTFDNLQDEPDHVLRELTLKTLSGTSYIVGVANYRQRYATVDDSGNIIRMTDALDKATTWDKYREISIGFDASGNASIETPLNPLVMSGTYTSKVHADGSMADNEAVDINPGVSKLAGAIHLRRMISQVKFNVSYNQDNISDFVIKSWKVVNTPTHAWLKERGDDEKSANAADQRPAGANRYMTTDEMHELNQKENCLSFDFWMLENKRTGLAPSGSFEKNPYAYREREHKVDGKNTGKFSALVESADSEDYNNMASYIVIDVEMLMSKDQNGKPITDSDLKMRRVETQYRIHLGYAEGSGMAKVRDFNCRRNSKYTYNVTINNVNDVLVEAQNDNERNPAVEGTVSDVLDRYYEVDAHYSCINVYLEAAELRNFEYLIEAYDLDGNEVTIDSQKMPTIPSDLEKYMNWVEIRPTTGEEVLAQYKPRSGTNSDGKTYLLSDLKAGKVTAGGWYTMFINEYVYEDATDGNESNSTNWHGYVNRPERKVWLHVLTQSSSDGESLYYRSKYAVSQKSIQTYYKMSSKSGLGVEHVNESMGLNMTNSYNSGGNGNVNSGRYNLAYRLAGNTTWSNNSFTWRDNRYYWSTFLSLTELQKINKINNQGVSRDARTEFLPKIKTVSGSKTAYDPDQTSRPYYIEAITACLNRNRDLDGDGLIDASEIRWFVPTRNQYVRIILGRRSLVTPILNVDEIKKLPYTDNKNNSSLLCYTSDGRQLWTMEGTSDSRWMQYGGGAPWQVRCVRNLGGNQSVINTTNITDPAFAISDNNSHVVDMKHYDSKSVRSEPYYSSDSPMPVHHLYDQRYNRCYSSFEVAESQYDITPTSLGVTSSGWVDYLAKNNPCKSLVSKTGKDGWRVPNQKELTIMAVLGLSPTSYNYTYSCTLSYFDRSGYAPGANPSDADGTLSYKYRYIMKVTGSGMGTQGGDGDENFIIRCVRDYTD